MAAAATPARNALWRAIAAALVLWIAACGAGGKGDLQTQEETYPASTDGGSASDQPGGSESGCDAGPCTGTLEVRVRVSQE